MPLNINGNIINSSIASTFTYKNIVSRGLIAALDASAPESYPGSGATWFDMTGNANGTINGVSFVNDGMKSYFNFATVSDSNYISSTVSQAYVDFTAVIFPDFSASGIVGIFATSTAAAPADKSLRAVADGTNAWNFTGRNPGDANDWANPSATTFYINGAASNTFSSGWNILGGAKTNTAFPSPFSYHLGSSGYANRGFKGRYAAMFFYNRALTGAEQIQNYNILRARFGL